MSNFTIWIEGFGRENEGKEFLSHSFCLVQEKGEGKIYLLTLKNEKFKRSDAGLFKRSGSDKRIKDGEREEDIEVSVEAEFVLMEEEVLPSLFLLDFIFYSKQYIYALSSFN